MLAIFWVLLAACLADLFLIVVAVKTYQFICDYNFDHGHGELGSAFSGLLMASLVIVFAVAFSFRVGCRVVEMADNELSQPQYWDIASSSTTTLSSPVAKPSIKSTPSPLPKSTPPSSGTTAYTFTSTHTIVGGRTDCKWRITHTINGMQDCANGSTVYLTPGSTVYLKTDISETSGTNGHGTDNCHLDNVPKKTFWVRRNVDVTNDNGTVTSWEIVYTFTLDKSKPTQTPQPTSTPRPTAEPTTAPASTASGSWGEDETTDETIGSSSRTVYWVPNGKSYHFSRSCPSLSRSTDIRSGTLQEARDKGYRDPCNNCVI